VGRPLRGFETTVGVAAASESARVTVIGAIVGDGVGRLIRIDDYGVDVPAEGCVLVLRNRDVPGVIGKVGQKLGAASINIASYHQSRGPERGGDALAAIVVDQIPPSAVIQALETIREVMDVRVARLDG
jgi:D-3-phosphoglycerate dehydrogenase